MMRTKEKEIVMNLIYKDYCKLSNAASSNSDLIDVKRSIVNLNGGLVDYLDNNSEDEVTTNNHTAASERMQ